MLNYRLLFLVLVLAAGFGVLGFARLTIDTDVVRSLPSGDKVIADGLRIFEQHPVHDQVAVDIAVKPDNTDILTACGDELERRMRESGLFARVGTSDTGELLAPLALTVAENLPILFSAEDLQEMRPLLDPEKIREKVAKLHAEMAGLSGIGQAEFIRLDPLGFKDLVLARMSLMAPASDVRFYRGHLLSGDGRHLLVTARPLAAATDTAAARKISRLFAEAGQELSEQYAASGVEISLTPVGAYRAALDNEQIIRHDVQVALIFSTLGIAVLLLISFSRPLIGLLSLVPALAGTATALLVYSLVRDSISIMVLGFGGAIISITVDHGIAYLLFLDAPGETGGRKASRELKAVGFMAAATTIVAFLILSASGFSVFTELGLFTCLGIGFSFLFVHTVFPRILPAMPGGSARSRPLQKLVTLLYSTGKTGAWAAALAAAALLFFASPRFHVSLSSMNTVTPATERADALFTETWGKLEDRVYLVQAADTVEALQQRNDSLLDMIEQDVAGDVLSAAFVPSFLFPGPERSAENLAAWQAFWNKTRVQKVGDALREAGKKAGFTPDAFAPFLDRLDAEGHAGPLTPSESYFELLGISKAKDAGLTQFITLVPGKEYDPERFFERYSSVVSIFDANYFTKRLARLLFHTFTTMLAIVAGSMVLLILLVSLSPALTVLMLLPPAFAYVCTLGTLNLIGRPLDIPAVMLSIVILGMGIDYAIFCVRAHQRYRNVSHPSYVQVRSAVFLAGTSTLIGFGVLVFAEHSLLRSIGVTSFFGIAYSLIGTFLLLPPLLQAYFSEKRKGNLPLADDPIRRTRRRYRTLEAYPRMFARFKLHFDPMFKDLPRMLAGSNRVRNVLDIGCGYGVPACWFLENYPEARIHGMDPDPERIRVAAIALGERGSVMQGWAPEVPPLSGDPADVVLLLDMLHYLDDRIAADLVRNCYQALAPGGILVARWTICPGGRPSWSWRLEAARIKSSGGRPFYRNGEEMSRLLTQAGFSIIVNEVSANPELAWLVGRADKG